jgi:hypothetical protein
MRLFLGVGCAVVASHEFDASMDVELREENPKTSPETRKPHQYFLRGSMSALSFPKLPGDVKD